MQEQMISRQTAETRRKLMYLPREHGATAMLLTPIVSVAILAREWRWAELAVLTGAIAAMAAKDPLVVVLRQRLVWKQQHAETAVAARWLGGWGLMLAASGAVLALEWPVKALAAMTAGMGAFGALALWVNVKNRQRSTLFQVASAAALTSTSLATCLAATGEIARWCWWFWLLSMLQAAAGILVVHARLDARIALRSPAPTGEHFRRAAMMTLGVIACAAATAALMRKGWIAAALVLAAAGYGYDLARQRDAGELQRPLVKVGQRTLLLSSVYSALLIVGLW